MHVNALKIICLCVVLDRAFGDDDGNQAKPESLQKFLLYFLSGALTSLMVLNWFGALSWSVFFKRSPIKIKDKYFGAIGEEELKAAFIVRNGKIGAQCGHAALGLYQRAVKNNSIYLNTWLRQGQRKVVLKGDEENQLKQLERAAKQKNLTTYLVADAGRTQIESGSLTVLAIGPGPESLINQITGHLKLL